MNSFLHDIQTFLFSILIPTLILAFTFPKSPYLQRIIAPEI